MKQLLSSYKDFLFKRSKRFTTPTIVQTEITECGAVALGIILAYYGRWEPLEKLRIQCGVSRDATNMDAIMSAAISYHLAAMAFGPTADQLRQHIKSPLIIHWEFKHFVVLEGFGSGKVYINDPAEGPREITDEEFQRCYTVSKGSMLLLKPGDGFEINEEPPGIWANVIKRLRLVEDTSDI